MAIAADDEWRSPADALAYDTLLLQSVFSRLRRRNAADGILELEYYSKQEVIDELEVHEQRKLLRRRPNLRKLHTRLASLTNIQESVSLDMFRITRVRDKTISFEMAAAMLRELCRSQLDAEAERQRLLRLHYKPMWCTCDPKMKLRSPATTYNVCFKPPHVLTAREKLARERLAKCIAERALVVAQLFVQQLLAPYFQVHRRRSQATPVNASADPMETEPATSPTRTRRRPTNHKVPAASLTLVDDARRVEALKLQLLYPGLTVTDDDDELILPCSLANATDEEGFIVAVESAGDVEIAKRLWAQGPLRDALRAVTEDVATPDHKLPRHAQPQAPTTKAGQLLASYRVWMTKHRTKTLKRLK
ncbi:Aste57867_22063 [Aphanomyces stellatus]|uniref:Aste57867_22063 protein n=1 Tax=Aphanomyces stellatus TaxID=120398 RepID=A0A485LK02_9STRA|nr:hypothetical protein As57867_021994 [Aphanomyces stellatus]VFT98731.1 Aste57867_22063 [Aphanomyces stellatus]